MLPGPPASARWSLPLPALLASVLTLLLTLGGCQGVGQPPRSVLLQALALQIELTQTSIANALGLEPVGQPQVSRVRVERQEAVPIGETRGLHLTGRFDWRLASDPFRVDSPFELYLQRGERGESWRLAQPLAAPSLDLALDGPATDTGVSEREGKDGVAEPLRAGWRTYPLPLKGERSG